MVLSVKRACQFSFQFRRQDVVASFVADTSTAGAAVVVDESVNIVVDLMATWAYACGLSQLIIIIIIIHLLIKVYKIHKCNKTSRTEQDSKAH